MKRGHHLQPHSIPFVHSARPAPQAVSDKTETENNGRDHEDRDFKVTRRGHLDVLNFRLVQRECWFRLLEVQEMRSRASAERSDLRSS